MTSPPASLLEIDLDAIASNWRFLAAKHSGATAGVLKADGYGLGAAQVAAALYAAGCRHFFTAHLSEALAIRPLVPDALVAVLHGILPGEAGVFAGERITPVLGSLADIARWRAEAAVQGETLPALLHVDTGMARTGLAPAEVDAVRDDASLLNGIDVQILMTHLVSAELPDDEINQRQLAGFAAAKTLFPSAQASLANSAGLFLGPDFTADLARPGAALYGINPTPWTANPMQPVVRLTARVLQIREIGAGETVGYNGTWTARRPSRIATVPVGYADGFLRNLSNNTWASFGAAKLPLVGRVSMDLTTFDVTDAPEIEAGDALELIGPGHDADALAVEAGTNGYEILTSLGRRYQRLYNSKQAPLF
jgi:alanine racemase